jgi:hypothetical protein
MSDAPPEWDEARARSLIGKRVLIGITYPADGGRQEQMFGEIVHAEQGAAIVVALGGVHKGRTYNLPADLSALHPAAPGEYRLRSTGDTVTDPDFISTWTIRPPEQTD